MTSQKQIEANRRNGRKGRGRRTAAGKSESRMNARKHGLSLPILADRNLHGDALKIARAIAGEGADYAVIEQALIIAQTELELQRVRQARLAAININMVMNETNNKSPQNHVAEGASSSHSVTPSTDSDTTTAEAFVHALPVLQRIERYERRAYSRRAKAMVCLDGLRAVAQCVAKG